MLSADDILFEFDSPRVDYSETLYTLSDCLKAMRIYRNQGIQQASEVCSEMLTDGFVISNVPAVLALKEEV